MTKTLDVCYGIIAYAVLQALMLLCNVNSTGKAVILMQDTRRTIQAFFALQSKSAETSLDLTGLVVQLAATTPAILYIFNLQTRRAVFLNKRIYDALGYLFEPAEEITSELLTRLMHPEDLHRMPTMLQQFDSASDNDVLTDEYRLRHVSGGWRWISCRSVVFQRDAEGRPFQILTTAEDVTEHRETVEALRDKATQLQAVLDTAVDAILTIDEQGIIETFNHAAVCMFDYTPEEVIGQNVKMLMPAPYHAEHDGYLSRYLETGKRKIIGIGREVIGRRKDGTTLPLDLSVSEAWCGRRVFTGILRDLTERNAAQVSLREQAYLIEQAHDAIIVRDLDGRILSWNKGAEAMYGWSEEEAIGQITHDLFQTQFPDSREAVYHQLLQTGRWEGELLHTRRDGTLIVVASRHMMPRDPKGQPLSMLESNTDITARKHSERLLKESEARLQLALENAGLGLWDWDLITHQVRYDDHWMALLGYSSEELDRRITSTEAMIHPEDREQVLAALQRSWASEEVPYDVEYRSPHKSGKWVWIHARGKVHSRDQDGKPLRMIGTVQDITARKQAAEVLRESEARFRLLADSAPVLIWTSGLNTLCTYFNKPWLDFTGRSMEEEVGNGWAQGIYPEDFQSCMEACLTAFEGRQAFRREYRLRRRDGQYRWILDTGTPRFSLDGTFLGYIGSCIDITDQKVLQEQLFESQKLESMGRLAGGIAHDFNNLLTAILGYTTLACDTLPEDSEVQSFLDNVTVAAERAAELTRQLLMYARRQMVEFTTFDINKVILDMDPLLRRIIGEQYELVTLLAEDTCCVNANASQMEQVLTNLVVNARDAMPEGGRILIETASVILDTEYAERHSGTVPGEYVMYAVSDTGMGMTEEVRNRIFEPFYTTKGVGKGTGLGLATCYGIVKQSKGNIWVYSEPGEGTTFKVYLPRVRDAAQSKPVKLPDELPEGTETILLVDDEPMVRDIAARTLRGQGYRVLEAGNGAEALHRYNEWPGEIDMLVTDVVMPLMGGKELAQRLQEMHPTLKVLYMSGYTQNVVLQQGVLKSDVVLLTKPFTAASLFQKVREVLITTNPGDTLPLGGCH